MAIHTTRTLAALKAECRKLGIVVEETGRKLGKTEYVQALRSYYIAEKYPEGLPKELDMILKVENPMLCERIQNCKEDFQEEIWESKTWVAEPKHDGVRIMIVHIDGEGFSFYSRNNSVTDFLPVSYRDTIDMSMLTGELEGDFIVDCELICKNPNINTSISSRYGVVTETQLQAVAAILSIEPEDSIALQQTEAPLEFIAFDVLYNQDWILDKPLYERKKILAQVVESLQGIGFPVVKSPTRITNKRAYYNYMIRNGNEGVVLKDLESPYIATSSRAHRCWVKAKRSTSEALGDTIDGFITGFVTANESRGWADLIGGLKLSVFLNTVEGVKVHQIATVSNIPMEKRREMTEIVDGKPVLKQEYYSKVIECDGQCITARARRLKHAVIVRWRPDKSPDQCVMDEEFLNSQIL